MFVLNILQLLLTLSFNANITEDTDTVARTSYPRGPLDGFDKCKKLQQSH